MNDTRSMYASSNGNVQNRDHYVFGWGRRICPGIFLVSNNLIYKNKLTNFIVKCRPKMNCLILSLE